LRTHPIVEFSFGIDSLWVLAEGQSVDSGSTTSGFKDATEYLILAPAACGATDLLI